MLQDDVSTKFVKKNEFQFFVLAAENKDIDNSFAIRRGRKRRWIQYRQRWTESFEIQAIGDIFVNKVFGSASVYLFFTGNA